MEWSVVQKRGDAVLADLLVVAVTRREGGPDLERPAWLAAAIGDGLPPAGAGSAFSARPETWLLLPCRGAAAPWLLLVGVGDPAQLSLERLRRCAGKAAEQARRAGAQRCALVLPELPAADLRAAARAWVEGAERLLGEGEAGRSASLRGSAGEEDDDERRRGPAVWIFAAPEARRGRALADGMEEGVAFAEGMLLARRLVNLPANLLTPGALAREAQSMARREGYACRVLGPAGLEKLGMGALLGVGKGSSEQPRLIILESPAATAPRAARGRRRPLIALVGKGLTFDAGGLSLKTGTGMETMKIDMAGAAAVLGAALTISRLRLPVRLLVVIPAAENMPSGSAIRPGDVLRTAAGKSVEVLNTDAEGRLVLADALHYACGRAPDHLIDAATLTGACVVALGREFAGLMSNDAGLIEALTQAGGDTFERVWHLPLVEEHSRALRSEIADLKNIGPREGGALTAAAFLSAFVDEKVPWAHIDLAGPVWLDRSGPGGPRGATGFGARLLARAVQLLAA